MEITNLTTLNLIHGAKSNHLELIFALQERLQLHNKFIKYFNSFVI